MRLFVPPRPISPTCIDPGGQQAANRANCSVRLRAMSPNQRAAPGNAASTGARERDSDEGDPRLQGQMPGQQLEDHTNLTSKTTTRASRRLKRRHSGVEPAKPQTVNPNVCAVCSERLKHLRFICTSCSGYALCLGCFTGRFPYEHAHPIPAFARDVMIRTPKALEICGIFPCHPDELTKAPDIPVYLCTDIEAVSIKADGISGPTRPKRRGQKAKVQPKPDKRRICAFCNDDKEDDGIEAGSTGRFIGPEDQAFVITSATDFKRKFYAHENCAKFNPDVFQIGVQWYNVAHVLEKRAKRIKCQRCHYRGATIGCFAPECSWSFHVRCTGQRPAEFVSGKVFWCAKHDPAQFGFDESFSCDNCGMNFGPEDEFYTCLSCKELHAFNTVDICKGCYVARKSAKGIVQVGHVADHDDERWDLVTAKSTETDQTAVVKDLQMERNKLMGIRTKMTGPSKRPRKAATACFYCWSDADLVPESLCTTGELPTCSTCYAKGGVAIDQLASLDRLLKLGEDGAGSEENGGSPTKRLDKGRDGLGTEQSAPSAREQMLKSYRPEEEQLYSLHFDHTFYDIEDRAPRWANHSGAYHGQWLPQIPRYSILRFTKPDDLILSNFLGQGTDAVEGFLLQRKVVGVDVSICFPEPFDRL